MSVFGLWLGRLHRRLHRAERTEPVFARRGPGTHVSDGAAVTGSAYIELGARVYIHDGVRLEALDANPYTGQALGSPRLVLEDGVSINRGAHIGCIGEVVVEQDVAIGGGVFITDHNYRLGDPDIALKNQPLSFDGAVRIGRGSVLGEHACILPGVTVGEFSMVGAGAVVTHDVPPRSVVAGVPARVLRRFDEGSGGWVEGGA
ncbi:MAG: acyltransferase [Candidatus Dormibacteria bacterium]